MKHIMQRNSHDCGFAVAAMLADCSYEDILRYDPPKYMPRQLMHTILMQLTGTAWHKDLYRIRPKLVDIVPLPRSAVLLWDKAERRGHWIGMEGETVYDPEWYAPRPLILANMSGYRVITTICRVG